MAVIIWEMVGGDEIAATVDLEQGVSADCRMAGKVGALTGDAVFSVATTAANPSFRAAVIRLVAAVDTQATTVCSGARGRGTRRI